MMSSKKAVDTEHEAKVKNLQEQIKLQMAQAIKKAFEQKQKAAAVVVAPVPVVTDADGAKEEGKNESAVQQSRAGSKQPSKLDDEEFDRLESSFKVAGEGEEEANAEPEQQADDAEKETQSQQKEGDDQPEEEEKATPTPAPVVVPTPEENRRSTQKSA